MILEGGDDRIFRGGEGGVDFPAAFCEFGGLAGTGGELVGVAVVVGEVGVVVGDVAFGGAEVVGFVVFVDVRVDGSREVGERSFSENVFAWTREGGAYDWGW